MRQAISQARFSNSYILIIARAMDGSWEMRILGPSPKAFRRQYAANADEAKRALYSWAMKHFIRRGIAEIPTGFDSLQWVTFEGDGSIKRGER